MAKQSDKQPKAKHAGGRKTLYTPAMVKQLEDALATGVSTKDAVNYCGISETQFYLWMNKYPEFAERMNRARAEGRLGAAVMIRQAAVGGDIEAAKWFLERTDAQHWGRATKVLLSVDPSLQINLQRWAERNNVNLEDVFEALMDESIGDDEGEE